MVLTVRWTLGVHLERSLGPKDSDERYESVPHRITGDLTLLVLIQSNDVKTERSLAPHSFMGMSLSPTMDAKMFLLKWDEDNRLSESPMCRTSSLFLASDNRLV
ncbi:hypothetical protein LR48_Vigan02g118000 [Vigna angularis]|uniref:Uncharacterized protein n=1 Tax=Phaseolus angularis TaxID=3914 RepID=A0A0L9TWX0_PHAAN|nr:hypothetical protein LR48_Vigan02g118000 [Vigna angularis]